MRLDLLLGLEKLVDFFLRLALGVEVGVDVTVATLVRRQRQGCWDVYCIAAVGQMRTHRDMGYYHSSSTCVDALAATRCD